MYYFKLKNIKKDKEHQKVMRSLSKLVVVFLMVAIFGGCASVEKNTQEQNSAQNQLRSNGVEFTVDSFIREAGEGNLDNIKLFVQGGINVNAVSSETALSAACFFNKSEVVKFLIENGANVNLGSYYAKPILAAVKGGNYDIVKLMIDNKANLNVTGYGNCSPLFIAAEQGKSEIAELLIQNGADVHFIQQLTGATVLTGCVKNLQGNLATAEVLVKAGANVNYKDPTGMSVLDWSISHRKFDIAKYLLSQGADVLDGTPINTTPRTLLTAIAWGDADLVKMLVDHGANINSKAFGTIPLVIWCSKNLLESMAIYIISIGAKTDVTYNGSSLIDFAIKNREEALIKKLDPNYDMSKLGNRIIDPNIQPQTEQINQMIGGYYKAQRTATVNTAVEQAVKTNAEVSEAANQAVGKNVQDDVNAQGTGNVSEAKAVSGALKQQGETQNQSLEYPVDQQKLEKEIDNEIKNIEDKYSDGIGGNKNLTQEEDNWYQPVTTPSPTDTLYDSPIGKPNQNKIGKPKPALKPYQYVSPSTQNAELVPDANTTFPEDQTQVQPISQGELVSQQAIRNQLKGNTEPGNIDQLNNDYDPGTIDK